MQCHLQASAKGANCLKLVLDKCTSIKQIAFVPNHSILDNVMLAFEIIHHLKNKRKGKTREVAFII